MIEMNYCMQCGTKLHMKRHATEGEVPFCDVCKDWRFPVFNTAVSMIVTNAAQDKIILIQQYGRPFYILCAGYVNQGEDAEDAVIRELKEELGLDAHSVHFNHSHYFAPSNTLMLNFTAVVDEENAQPNWEIDSWHWFDIQEARKKIKPGSLAAAFLNGYLDGHYAFPASRP
ncbi:MAG: NUDIX domain-containing protein [Clostridia bacterium]|nr:NUDIX domain-containing protein [Clostridia bacterium]